MQLVLVALLIALVVSACIAVKSKSNAGKGRRITRKTSKYEDEDNYDDDDEPVRSSPVKKSRISSKSMSSKKKMPPKNQLIRWGDQKKGKGKVKTLSLKERLEALANQGQNVYKSAYRQVKTMRSSAFESMLLKATWPSDDPVPNEILNEIIRHSIPAFKYGRSVRASYHSLAAVNIVLTHWVYVCMYVCM